MFVAVKKTIIMSDMPIIIDPELPWSPCDMPPIDEGVEDVMPDMVIEGMDILPDAGIDMLMESMVEVLMSIGIELGLFLASEGGR